MLYKLTSAPEWSQLSGNFDCFATDNASSIEEFVRLCRQVALRLPMSSEKFDGFSTKLVQACHLVRSGYGVSFAFMSSPAKCVRIVRFQADGSTQTMMALF